MSKTATEGSKGGASGRREATAEKQASHDGKRVTGGLAALSDAAIERTRRATAERDKNSPRAATAWYSVAEDRIAILLKNDVEIHIPASKIQGLRQATPAQKSHITLTASGNALHWEDLDVQMSVEGLVAGVFGTESWMHQLRSKSPLKHAAAELGRQGGRARSEVKTVAVRENGKKGGRPRKTAAA